ncbi:MAG TPA: hypothetical protein VHI97_02260 [Actinomycetota bacterium]|nr:hypothetical protein [Actinomycetota bacterium]
MADVPPPPSMPPPPSGDPALPPRGVGEVIGAALDLYRRNALPLLTIVALVVIPLAILGAVITALLEPDPGESRSLALVIGTVLVGVVVAVITSAILQAAVLRGAANATLGEPVDVSDSYRWGFQRLGSVLLIALLVTLALIAAFVPFILVVIAVPVLAIIVWVLPFAVYVLLSVSVPSLVIEGRRGTAALGRSWNLVKAHFWHAVGVILLTFIVSAVVGFILGLIGGDNEVVATIMSIISQIIVAPFTALATVLLYLNLRTRAENLTVTQLRGELERS